MSKPLKLTVYEIDRTDPSMVVVDGFWAYRPYDPAKRLTDAELAAELHRAASVEYAAIADPAGFKPGAQQRAAIQCQILNRFAELSHYDEDVTP